MEEFLYFIRDKLVGLHYFIYSLILLFFMFAIIGHLFKQKYAKFDIKLNTSQKKVDDEKVETKEDKVKKEEIKKSDTKEEPKKEVKIDKKEQKRLEKEKKLKEKEEKEKLEKIKKETVLKQEEVKKVEPKKEEVKKEPVKEVVNKPIPETNVNKLNGPIRELETKVEKKETNVTNTPNFQVNQMATGMGMPTPTPMPAMPNVKKPEKIPAKPEEIPATQIKTDVKKVAATKTGEPIPELK